jgi:hypothetical protein
MDPLVPPAASVRHSSRNAAPSMPPASTLAPLGTTSVVVDDDDELFAALLPHYTPDAAEGDGDDGDDDGGGRSFPALTLRGEWVERLITFLVVAASAALVFYVVHPSKVFADTLPTGGDMGAHVWGAAYLRDHLLSHGMLEGWTPDWYAGFPAFRFYMVVPFLAIVLLNVGVAVHWYSWQLWLAVLAVGFVGWRVVQSPSWRRHWRALVVAATILLLGYFAIPYGVSFKLVTIAGVVSMPISGWAMGRLANLPFPMPALLAVGTLPFVFDRSFNIYGGNVASTMAGEFAFSISLSLCLVYIGALIRSLDTGRGRGSVAILIAVAGLCHLIPVFFALGVTAVLFLLRPSRTGLKVLFTALPVGGLISAFWVLPFYFQSTYLNDMGWEKTLTYRSMLLTRAVLNPSDVLRDSPPLELMLGFALVGAVMSVRRSNRLGLALTVSGIFTAIAFVFVPDARLWNARLLPFYYLCVYLVGALGVGEIVRSIGDMVRIDRADPWRAPTILAGLAGPATLVLAFFSRYPKSSLPGLDGWTTADILCLHYAALVILASVGIAVVALLVSRLVSAPDAVGWTLRILLAPAIFAFAWVGFGLSLRVLPGASVDRNTGAYEWGPFSSKDVSFLPGWANWNYRGYEGATPSGRFGGYPEFRQLMLTMGDIGKNRGCGRAMWEYDEGITSYGTTMAPMLLPHFTDGCIGSMEGLYFEASSTTPYHFLNQAALSEKPSSAQRDLRYPAFDMDLGIRQLQLEGVRYYLANSDAAKGAAAKNTSLTQIGTAGVWTIYLVADSPLVQGLANLPNVYTNVNDTQDQWLQPAAEWFKTPTRWSLFYASDGPANWPRITIPEEDKLTQKQREAEVRSGALTTAEPPAFSGQMVAAEPVQVTNIDTTRDGISFDVDTIGQPVLVKISYFPNWKATGADGPYRVTPNFMVVVPTTNHVELHYRQGGLEYGSMGISVIGLLLLALLVRSGALATPRFWWDATPPLAPLLVGGTPPDGDQPDGDDHHRSVDGPGDGLDYRLDDGSGDPWWLREPPPSTQLTDGPSIGSQTDPVGEESPPGPVTGP